MTGLSVQFVVDLKHWETRLRIVGSVLDVTRRFCRMIIFETDVVMILLIRSAALRKGGNKI